ncbi:DNA translocase FtsK [Geminicoccaceae bacterium 1502E]|nr:DNA translocase FtsK [Geminicoccaceae bacterium 1502E]
MASSTFDAFGDRPVAVWLRSFLRRAGGAALAAAALWLAVALWGFDPADPSLNHATGTVASNPAGITGAYLADLLYQMFGLAAWLVILATASWGIRIASARPLDWPWLPVLVLPFALLAAAAFFAAQPAPPRGEWPFRVGLGGFVGDFFLARAQPSMPLDSYALTTGLAALLLGVLALGLRWTESVWAMGRLATASRWAGRHVGEAASRAGVVTGRAVTRGVRHSAAAVQQTTAALPERVAKAGLAGRLGSLLERRRVEGEEPAEQPAQPRLRPRRPGTIAEPQAEELEPEGAFAGEDEPAPEPRRLRRTASRPAAVPARAEPAPRRLDDEPLPWEMPAEDDDPEPAEDAAPVQIRHQPPREVPARAAPPPQRAPEGEFELPTFDMLAPAFHEPCPALTKEALHETARQLEAVLDDFGVRGQIIDVKPGPVVTLYELEPAPGTRSQRVISLADDIARSLCALSVRVATVPGRNVIGIELPNERRETVFLRELFESDRYARSEARLAMALGKDISGNPVIVDLARMPHLLIAGTTGSGKSVAINAMILSLLYRLTPDECRIIMIDPKVIELSVYEDIPHLLAPVVTEPHKAVVALKWVVRQMDERYRLMSHLGVRDIFAFNRRILQAKARGEQLTRRVRTGFEPGTGVPIYEEQPIPMEPLPLIVVIVDEVADLMLTAGKEIENAIQRLSQKARAAGVHLIVATQRPSVDVITGVIKANLPSRISFRVSSKIDSRTVLGDAGAEQLLGQGDMLYLMPGDRINRIHGALVTDAEVEAVVRHLKTQGPPEYDEEVTSEGAAEGGAGDAAAGVPGGDGGDSLYNQAVQVVARDGKASTSYLQRKLSVGYNSAAKLIERMEQDGLISAADHVGRRQVLMGRGGVDGDEPTDI